MINLTKNEKKVLKILLENSRTTDSEIASKLKITSQAVGKIRKKLENNIIDGYNLNISYRKIGINIMALAIAKITKEGLEKGTIELEHELTKKPNIISLYRLPKIGATYIIIYGFSDMQEMENFFYNKKMNEEIYKYLDIQEIHSFSSNSIIKKDSTQLIEKIIDEDDTEKKFKEITDFKKKIKNIEKI